MSRTSTHLGYATEGEIVRREYELSRNMAKQSTAGTLRIPLGAELDEALESRPDNPRGYIGASMVASECERAVWYDFLWATPKAFPGRICRRFDQGHDAEERIIEYLRLAGYEVRDRNTDGRQFRANYLGGLISGGMDGQIRGRDLGRKWHLLETKIVVSAKYHYDPEDTDYLEPLANRHPTEHPTKAGNEANIEGSWWQLKRMGVKRWKQQHYGQLQVYMGLSHDEDVRKSWGLDQPMDRALYVAMNGDTAQVHAELVEYEPKWFAAAIARAKRVARNRDEGPERKRDTAMFPPCAFCDHKDVCHRGDAMQRTCRTCVHAEVKLPGDEGYAAHVMQWHCNLHNHGCGDFSPCSQHQQIDEQEMF